MELNGVLELLRNYMSLKELASKGVKKSLLDCLVKAKVIEVVGKKYYHYDPTKNGIVIEKLMVIESQEGVRVSIKGIATKKAQLKISVISNRKDTNGVKECVDEGEFHFERELLLTKEKIIPYASVVSFYSPVITFYFKSYSVIKMVYVHYTHYYLVPPPTGEELGEKVYRKNCAEPETVILYKA